MKEVGRLLACQVNLERPCRGRFPACWPVFRERRERQRRLVFAVVSFSYDLPGHREEGGESNAHVVVLYERLAVFVGSTGFREISVCSQELDEGTTSTRAVARARMGIPLAHSASAHNQLTSGRT